MQGGHLRLEVLQRVAVVDDLVGGGQPLGTALLPREHLPRQRFINAVAAHHAGDLVGLGCIHHQHALHQVHQPAFQQDGGRKNAVRRRLLRQPVPQRGANVRVGDGFQLFERGGIAKHHGAQGAAVEHAIGLHAASLVRDGGTLQIGIGALGDAICHALRLRDGSNARYRDVMAALGSTRPDTALEDFQDGLYGCS